MCFWLSTRTMNDGTFTICLPTLRGERRASDEDAIERLSAAWSRLQTDG